MPIRAARVADAEARPALCSRVAGRDLPRAAGLVPIVHLIFHRKELS
jgi:hypothetical protein